jgi:hypothetical protein
MITPVNFPGYESINNTISTHSDLQRVGSLFLVSVPDYIIYARPVHCRNPRRNRTHHRDPD